MQAEMRQISAVYWDTLFLLNKCCVLCIDSSIDFYLNTVLSAHIHAKTRTIVAIKPEM